MLKFDKENLDLQLDPQYQYDLDPERMKNIIPLLDGIEEPILDCGASNKFGRELAEKLNVTILNTHGDLDYLEWAADVEQIYKTIWVFELIEHLKNPALFLERLKRYLDHDTRIFFMYPYRIDMRFWSHNHWHEIEPSRFRLLMKDAGFEIVQFKQKILYRHWTFYLRGIRPIIRLLFGRYYHNYYEVKLK